MNECFLIGKIIKRGEFRFILGDNLYNKSAIELLLKTNNNQEIRCVAFDKIADFIYHKECKYVCIRGKLKTKGYVKISEIIPI